MFIFSLFLSFMFCLTQIWSQNLTFSKVIGIWYSGKLLYSYYDFNIYFFKIIFIHFLFFIFLEGEQIWFQNLNFFKLTEVLYMGTLLYVYCNFNIHFLKIFVSRVFCANLVGKSDKFSKLTEIVEKCVILAVTWFGDPSCSIHNWCNVCRLCLVSFAWI